MIQTLVHPTFAPLIESLEPKRRALLGMRPVTYLSLPTSLPSRGIYLFSEGDHHLYVGRTNNLKQRLAGHCRPSSNHFSASFAFRLAHEETGNTKATYKTERSRAALLEDEAFAKSFKEAKERLSSCDLRFVAEDDATRQALLEIYVASVLATPYNDFNNH